MKKHITLFSLLLLSLNTSLPAQTTTFNFTGAPQIYVVPAGCAQSVEVDVRGAQGGGNAVVAGGLGGRTVATIPVTPGETLYIYVGGTGDVTGTPGYNGGGSGIGGSAGNPGSGGGGASDVRKGGTTLNDRWVVGGGGGGGTENGGTAVGGAGGGLVGADGNPGGNPWGCSPLLVATGGTQTAGGLGGTSSSCAWNGSNGAFGIGGDSHNNYRCAGGGGGWYGGGGAHNGTSGAGGSSYTHPSATSVAHTQGFQSGNGQVILTLQAALAVDLGPDTASCGSIALDAGHPGSTYLWSTGATGQTISATASGTYSVTVTDSLGCLGADTVQFTLDPPPAVDLGADTAVCAPLTLDAGYPGSTYLWSTSATTQTIIVSPGTYSVTVTNALGCPGSDTIVVSTATNPIVNLGGSITGCDSVTVDAGNPGSSFLWSNGATTQIVTLFASGTYSVTVTEPTCSFTGSDAITVTIGSTALASFTGLDSGYCDFTPAVTLVGSPPGGVFSGNGISGNSFDPGTAGLGQHTITYTFVDSVGCTSVATAVTLVFGCPAVGNPFPGTLQLYPNPNTGKFVLEGCMEETQVEVYNVVGERILVRTATSSRMDIDLSGCARGMYFVRLWMEGKGYVGRVMVE